METSCPKFCFSARRLVFLTTAFILLSVSDLTLANEGDGRRCFWCGPLAEQVHRSARAGSCDAEERQVTVCEPGYNYCAIVATTPPYVESRYCVKLYQDECYPLFCNTTGSWKMACPCRGDLCNEIKTEREIEAFQMLPRLVAKTQNKRIKKRKSRFIRDSSKEDDSSVVSTKETGDDGNMNPQSTTNDISSKGETTEPAIEGNRYDQTSTKPSDSNQATVDSTVSLNMNHKESTVMTEKPSTDDQTTEKIAEEKLETVPEPVEISKEVENKNLSITDIPPQILTSTENNVIVVTEKTPSIVQEKSDTQKDNIDDNKVETDSHNDNKEMQSDEPAKDVAAVEMEKKETNHQITPETKPEITTAPNAQTMTTMKTMTTTEAVTVTTTMQTNKMTKPQQKSNSQSLYSFNNLNILFYLGLLVNVI